MTYSSYRYGIGYLVEGQGISWGLFNKYGRQIYVIRNGSILTQQKSPQSFVVSDRDRKQTALIDTLGNYIIPFQDNYIKKHRRSAVYWEGAKSYSNLYRATIISLYGGGMLREPSMVEGKKRRKVRIAAPSGGNNYPDSNG